MTTMTMHFAFVPRVTQRRGPAMVRLAGRRLADRWNAAVSMTPQERANAHVAHMPIAVLADHD